MNSSKKNKVMSREQIRLRNKNEIYNTEDRLVEFRRTKWYKMFPPRPDIRMLDSFREKVGRESKRFVLKFFFKIKEGYRHPRKIPIISPSKEFNGNVLKLFDKGLDVKWLMFQRFNILFSVYTTERNHLRRYLEAGFKLSSFIKHRKGDS